MYYPHRTLEGPIGGLYLPSYAWKALRREDIGTLDHLRASVDQLERFDRIGPKTAQMIRLEVARVAAL